jgi:Terminase RNaseH-like domain
MRLRICKIVAALTDLLSYPTFCSLLRVKQREGGRLVPYRPKAIQTDLVNRIHKTRGLCKLIILKARRLGITTAIASVIFHRVVTRRAQRGLVIAHRGVDAETIFHTYERFYTHLPQFFRFPRTGTKRRRLDITPLDSSLEVVSANAIDSGRGGDAQMIHCSEAAHYADMEAFLAAILPTLPLTGTGLLALESTANAAGDQFHELWKRSERGESGYVPIFYAWWRDKDFRLRRAIQRVTWSEEEVSLNARFGVDGHQIAWLREAERTICLGNSDVRRREFPSTPDEAFRSAKAAVWDLSDLEACFVKLPGKRYDINDRRVQGQNDAGPLTIYCPPEEGRDYVIGADPAGGGEAGDWCIGSVWTAERKYGEWPAQVAELAAHADPVAFAGLLTTLGRYYNKALIACEITGVGRGCGAALQRVYGYPRLHRQLPLTKSSTSHSSVYSWGWETSKSSKEILVGIASWLLKSHKITYHSPQLFEECCSFCYKDGSYEGLAGDDRVMAMMIGLVSWFQNAFPGIPLSEARERLAGLYDDLYDDQEIDATIAREMAVDRAKIRRMYQQYDGMA